MTAGLQILRAVILAFVARTELVAENLVLRQQGIVLRRGVVRPRIRPFDRWLISTLAGRFRALVEAIVLVKPETLVAWHRAGWRSFWRWRSRSGRPPGRPPSMSIGAPLSGACGAATSRGEKIASRLNLRSSGTT